jgi:hypothetical protein
MWPLRVIILLPFILFAWVGGYLFSYCFGAR